MEFVEQHPLIPVVNLPTGVGLMAQQVSGEDEQIVEFELAFVATLLRCLQGKVTQLGSEPLLADRVGGGEAPVDGIDDAAIASSDGVERRPGIRRPMLRGSAYGRLLTPLRDAVQCVELLALVGTGIQFCGELNERCPHLDLRVRRRGGERMGELIDVHQQVAKLQVERFRPLGGHSVTDEVPVLLEVASKLAQRVDLHVGALDQRDQRLAGRIAEKVVDKFAPAFFESDLATDFIGYGKPRRQPDIEREVTQYSRRKSVHRSDGGLVEICERSGQWCAVFG